MLCCCGMRCPASRLPPFSGEPPLSSAGCAEHHQISWQVGCSHAHSDPFPAALTPFGRLPPHRMLRDASDFYKNFAELWVVLDPRDVTDVFAVNMDVLWHTMLAEPEVGLYTILRQ